jgi:GDSL-like lipase/acylhydrolase family protein
MNFKIALIAAMALMNVAAFAAEECEVPPSFIASDSDLTRVAKSIKSQHRLDIAVVGTGSSTLPGPDGEKFAYPARLQEALQRLLPGNDIKVVAHVEPRQTTAEMAAELKKILAEEKPALVVWQAGTFDAVSGIDPDEFRASLAEGLDSINTAEADADLVNMQYSPRTETMLAVATYADIMRWVAQEHGALLFDRLAIMRFWNDQGTFDLYAATKEYDMARKVHDCIGRALASQIVNAAHLVP